HLHRGAGPARGSRDEVFFSSRSRHTRWPRDWSSDVCSSDLWIHSKRDLQLEQQIALGVNPVVHRIASHQRRLLHLVEYAELQLRSEERRVGKECGTGGCRGAEERKDRAEEGREEHGGEMLER